MSQEKNANDIFENQEVSLDDSSDKKVEPEQNKNNSISVENKNLAEFEVKAIVGAIPLEPCVALASVEDHSSNGQDYKIIGIPGFYDSQHEKFLLLDGSPVEIKGFQDKFNEFVKTKIQQRGEKKGII